MVIFDNKTHSWTTQCSCHHTCAISAKLKPLPGEMEWLLGSLRESVARRKTKLQAHHEIYEDRPNDYDKGIKRARQSLFSKIFNEDINNSKVLFSTVNLLNRLTV